MFISVSNCKNTRPCRSSESAWRSAVHMRMLSVQVLQHWRSTVMVGQVRFTVYTLHYIVHLTQRKLIPHFRHFLPFTHTSVFILRHCNKVQNKSVHVKQWYRMLRSSLQSVSDTITDGLWWRIQRSPEAKNLRFFVTRIIVSAQVVFLLHLSSYENYSTNDK